MRQLKIAFAVSLLTAGISVDIATAGLIADNFDDGNADGWVFPFNPNTTQFPGDWDVENGTLVQHLRSDHNAALLDNLVFSDQTIATQVRAVGYGGVVLWHQSDSWISVVVYPAWTGIVVFEVLNGQWTTTPYNHHTATVWYDLKVEANSSTGELAVYLDNDYLFTHVASVPRSGQSGLISGNEVVYFDNFRLSSGDNVPEPNSLALWGSLALMALVASRLRSTGQGLAAPARRTPDAASEHGSNCLPPL